MLWRLLSCVSRHDRITVNWSCYRVFEGCSTVEQRWRAVFDSVRPFECSFDRLVASVRGVEHSRHPGDPPISPAASTLPQSPLVIDYPLIAVLARRYLAIPASSTSSERLFSRPYREEKSTEPEGNVSASLRSAPHAVLAGEQALKTGSVTDPNKLPQTHHTHLNSLKYAISSL